MQDRVRGYLHDGTLYVSLDSLLAVALEMEKHDPYIAEVLRRLVSGLKEGLNAAGT